MIIFACPHCGRELQAEPVHVGKSGVCNHCKGAVVVPAANASQGVQQATTVANEVRELRRLVERSLQETRNLRISLKEAVRDLDYRIRDLMILAARDERLRLHPGISLETEHPLATTSLDHLFPSGTINDNTRWPRFVAACERIFPQGIRALDLGCSGGGLVLDFILRGHTAIGLEGSDVSLRLQRAEWRLLPNCLFTCDITKPFALVDKNCQEKALFDVISAWEVMEHIPREVLPQLLRNVRDHLAPGGLFVASIAQFPFTDPRTNATLHVTVESKEWWIDRFAEARLAPLAESPFEHHDFCRGIGQFRDDPSYGGSPLDPDSPQMPGFHVVLRKAD